MVCDAGEAILYPAELVVCPGLDASIYNDGHSRISGMAQGIGESTGQDSANRLPGTVGSKCLMVGGFLRS